MAHLRTQIRQAVKAALLGLPTTGANVFTSRPGPLPDSKLPALVIETNAEDASGFDLQDETDDRDLTLLVIGRAKHTDELDDVLDQIALEVEQAMKAHGAAALEGLAESISYSGMRVGASADLEKPAGEIRLAYAVRYLPASADPQST